LTVLLATGSIVPVPETLPASPPLPRTEGKERVIYLDHLRGFLMALVIVHHVAITYGAAGSWYYVEAGDNLVWSLVLTTFCATNQFFFMGLFFFLSALFVPPLLARKGLRLFLLDRFIRLGIPLLIYVVFITPLMMYLRAWRDPDFSWDTWFSRNVPLLRAFNPGPLWFVETLLIFSIAYVVWTRFRPSQPPKIQSLSPKYFFLFTASLIGLSFFIRLAYPIGREFWHLQLAFFPQYILLFAAGIVAARKGWLNAPLERYIPACRQCFGIGVSLLPILLLWALKAERDIDYLKGGWNAGTFALCVAEGLICLSAIIRLLVFFRTRWNEPHPLWSILARNSYGAYFIHPPVAVTLAMLFRDVPLPLILKFPLVAILSVTGSVVVSEWVLRKLPGLRIVFK
jgi:glucan biosynthesis protein C